MPKLPFVDYDSVIVDCDRFGRYMQIVRGAFDIGYVEGEFEDGRVLEFRRKWYVGRAKNK